MSGVTLVTGGGGFLGRHLVRALLARGERVRVVGRRPYPDLAAAGVECVQADVADLGALLPAFAGVETVFHVAALAGVWGPARAYERVNVTGTANVLAACERGGVRRLVYTSTPSVVYGRRPIRGGDESLPYPRTYLTHYARTKAAAERMVLEAGCAGRLRACAIRPHLVWGPGDTHLLPALAARARARRLVQVGEGVNLVSVSHVVNVAAAHVAAAAGLAEEAPVASGCCYFVNQPEPVNCWEFIRRLLARLGCPPVRRRISLPAAYALGLACEAAYRLLGITRDPPMTRFVALQLATDHWFRVDRARRDLGWEPEVTTEQGLAELPAAEDGPPRETRAQEDRPAGGNAP